MEQASSVPTTNRYAVVTGGNRGLGFEVCRQLASNQIVVVLTSRDENKGLEAIKKLKDSGIPDQFLVFHRLDVVDPNSIASLAEFVKTQFGKLDILVNNAGVLGVVLNHELLRAAVEHYGDWPDDSFVHPDDSFDWDEIAVQNFELAEECVKIGYYGVKGMIEAFVPLLQLSDSPRIVNLGDSMALLKNIPNEWARGLLSDIEGLTDEKIDQVLSEFLKDFKDGLHKSKGWPIYFAAEKISKAAMHAYTRMVAKKNPNFVANAVCPGFCRTDITNNLGPSSATEGAENVVRLALLPKDEAPSGCFFSQKQMIDF